MKLETLLVDKSDPRCEGWRKLHELKTLEYQKRRLSVKRRRARGYGLGSPARISKNLDFILSQFRIEQDTRRHKKRVKQATTLRRIELKVDLIIEAIEKTKSKKPVLRS